MSDRIPYSDPKAEGIYGGRREALIRKKPNMQNVRRTRIRQEEEFGRSKNEFYKGHTGEAEKRGMSTFKAAPGQPTLQAPSQYAGSVGRIMRASQDAQGIPELRQAKAAQSAARTAAMAPPPQPSQPTPAPAVDPRTGMAQGYDPALDNFQRDPNTKMAYSEMPEQYARRARYASDPAWGRRQDELAGQAASDRSQAADPGQYRRAAEATLGGQGTSGGYAPPPQQPQQPQPPIDSTGYAGIPKMIDQQLRRVEVLPPNSQESKDAQVLLQMLRNAQGKMANNMNPQQVAASKQPLPFGQNMLEQNAPTGFTGQGQAAGQFPQGSMPQQPQQPQQAYQQGEKSIRPPDNSLYQELENQSLSGGFPRSTYYGVPNPPGPAPLEIPQAGREGGPGPMLAANNPYAHQQYMQELDQNIDEWTEWAKGFEQPGGAATPQPQQAYQQGQMPTGQAPLEIPQQGALSAASLAGVPPENQVQPWSTGAARDKEQMAKSEQHIDYLTKEYERMGGAAADAAQKDLDRFPDTVEGRAQRYRYNIRQATLGGMNADTDRTKADTGRTVATTDQTRAGTEASRAKAKRDQDIYELGKLSNPTPDQLKRLKALVVEKSAAEVAEIKARVAAAMARAKGTTPAQLDVKTKKDVANVMSVVAGYLSGGTRSSTPSIAAIRAAIAKTPPARRDDLIGAIRLEAYKMGNSGDDSTMQRVNVIVAALGQGTPGTPPPAGATNASGAPIAPVQGSIGEKMSTATKNWYPGLGSASSGLASTIMDDKRVKDEVNDIVSAGLQAGQSEDQIVDKIMEAVRRTYAYHSITSPKTIPSSPGFGPGGVPRKSPTGTVGPRTTDKMVREAFAKALESVIRKKQESIGA